MGWTSPTVLGGLGLGVLLLVAFVVIENRVSEPMINMKLFKIRAFTAGNIVNNGIGSGLMAAPNSAAIMNSVPPDQRGAASGVRATGMNAGMVLSMGGFFSLMAIGLANALPSALYHGLTSLGVTSTAAQTISQTPPVGTLFAGAVRPRGCVPFLGANPIEQLMQAVDPTQLQPGGGADVATLTGQTFFPTLISGPFKDGLEVAFGVSIAMLLIAAVASLFRGGKFVHPGTDDLAEPALPRQTGRHRHTHESIARAMAREVAALEYPAAPGADVQYEAAVEYADALAQPSVHSQPRRDGSR